MEGLLGAGLGGSARGAGLAGLEGEESFILELEEEELELLLEGLSQVDELDFGCSYPEPDDELFAGALFHFGLSHEDVLPLS